MKQTRLFKWELRVEAKGYWFTSGGDKGSFGYYPHLKQVVNGKEYPVYPDTQIHGDLKMSAFWLSKLKPHEFSDDFVSIVFGDRNDQYQHLRRPSQVFVTDLQLQDREKWKNSRFQIKPRIEVEENRTVKEHMLVSLEMAYLEGLTLTSDIYLYGEFTEDEFNRAKKLIEESVKLLSGFGAFRSRGYGRGDLKLIEVEVNLPPTNNLKDNHFVLSLKSLVNFRNRQIYPGTEQTLKTEPFITSDKLKAWIIKAYKNRYDKWLTIEESSNLILSPLYPLMPDAKELSYPVPVTTLKNEQGKVFDLSGRDMRQDDQENLFSSKTKALPSNCFVTDSESPVIYETPILRRIRNSIDESFITLKKGGLISQEFIPAGQVFRGVVNLKGDDDFNKKIISLLNEGLVLINGCIFEAYLTPIETKEQSGSPPYLLTQNIPFDHDEGLINYTDCPYEKKGNRFIKNKANQIRLTTQRAYNTMLNRQRRPRIVIQSGSVINSLSQPLLLRYRTHLLKWKGFGKDITTYKPVHQGQMPLKTKDAIFKDEIESIYKGLLADGMTRSQAGFLRGYLNENQDYSFLEKLTKDRIEKYDRKGFSGFKALYERLYKYIQAKDDASMRLFINNLIDMLYTHWWDKRIGERQR